jgi:hypothetical protein
MIQYGREVRKGGDACKRGEGGARGGVRSRRRRLSTAGGNEKKHEGRADDQFRSKGVKR